MVQLKKPLPHGRGSLIPKHKRQTLHGSSTTRHPTSIRPIMPSVDNARYSGCTARSGLVTLTDHTDWRT
jgi:hypothetical protein